MHRCARCDQEIDASLARCPHCGLDQYRPPPGSGFRGFAERFVPYGDDRYPWQDDSERVGGPAPYVPPWGHGPTSRRIPAVGIAIVVGLVMIVSFLLIVSVR